MAPARGAHFFRKLVSRSRLVPIYAERGGAPQPAEKRRRAVPSGPPPLYSLISVFPVCTGAPVVRVRMRTRIVSGHLTLSTACTGAPVVRVRMRACILSGHLTLPTACTGAPMVRVRMRARTVWVQVDQRAQIGSDWLQEGQIGPDWLLKVQIGPK